MKDARTRAQILEERQIWLDARTALAVRGAAYTLPNGVSLTYQDIEQVNSHLTLLTRELETVDAYYAGNPNPSVSFAKWRLPSES